MRVDGPVVPVMLLFLVVGTAGTVSHVSSRDPLAGNVGTSGIVSNGPYAVMGKLGPPYRMRAATGPLKACVENPRYFCNREGEAVYLTGSHNWHSLKDGGQSDPPPAFDYPGYLDFLGAHNHNFIRLWAWELSRSDDNYSRPFPWLRTGPGMALDGKPRFDLHRFNQSYFDRLRARVVAAGDRGIYVSVMLFEGWALQEWQWEGHPFNASNNINGVDGDSNHDGRGTEVDTLLGPTVTRIQEAYVRKVIDSVNDLDNVLYEVANEAGPYSTAWQYHMIRYVKAVEAAKPKQHPVGMTFQWNGGRNGALFSSPADWVSPGRETPAYRTNPPPASGSKVILIDTDHLWGIGGDADWVWKSFTRGLNPLYMDDLQAWKSRERVRLAMGHTLSYANRLDLRKMAPHGELVSSGYCLAQPGVAYLVYAPEGGRVVVSLGETRRDFQVEWFRPGSGEIYDGGVARGAHLEAFRVPFSGPAVLFLNSR